jgi:hypothetical protein
LFRTVGGPLIIIDLEYLEISIQTDMDTVYWWFPTPSWRNVPCCFKALCVFQPPKNGIITYNWLIIPSWAWMSWPTSFQEGWSHSTRKCYWKKPWEHQSPQNRVFPSCPTRSLTKLVMAWAFCF